MKLVVGLGNPGTKYQQTRHNVGFEVVERLADRYGRFTGAARFESRTADAFIGERKVLLAEPETYMNLSGRAVRKLVDFYEIPNDGLLIVCDDMNLESGRVRLKPGGSAGGQKGLSDIIRTLGTQDFPRMRIGIGRPPGRMNSADYVLGRFRGAECEAVEHAILRAADAIEIWVKDGLEAAMNEVNAPAE